MEIWKDIEEYEGLYQVSNLGNVRSLHYSKERILKHSKNNKGYFLVSLNKNSKQKLFLVHRLVASAFLPNPDNKPCIDHINTDRTDNRVENLRWVTYNENNNNPITIKKISISHKGLHKGVKNNNYGKRGILNSLSKPILQFTKRGELVKKWTCSMDIKRGLGLNSSHILECCKGKRKSAGGYKWHYHYKSLWLKNHIPLIKQRKVA